MKSLKYLATISALVASSALAATTDPVGFVSTTVPANSDAVLAVPLNRASVFKGMIQTISGSTVTVAGTPAWTTAPQQFVQALPTQINTYAIQLASGAKEGLIAKIVSNTANSVTLQLNAGDDLTGVIAEDADGIVGNGDQIDIMPYWTPSTVAKGVPVATQILGFESPATGINLGNSEQFVCNGSDTWENELNFDDATHSPLKFGTMIILRNNAASPLSLSFVGSVPMSTHRIRLETKAGNTAQDNAFGFMSPVPESLSSVGNPSVPVPQQTANLLQLPVSVGDQILGFDNSLPGFNKGTAVQYTWTGTAWEDDLTLSEIDYTTKLQPGFGYIFRKAATTSATSLVWARLPSYLQ